MRGASTYVIPTKQLAMASTAPVGEKVSKFETNNVLEIIISKIFFRPIRSEPMAQKNETTPSPRNK